MLTRELYDHKVQLLIDAESERYKGKTKPQEMQKALNRFMLLGQVQGSQLYRRTKWRPTKVPYFEILFDIIHKAHLFLAHAKDSRVIISDTIGSHCQMDLIDYTRRPDMTKDGMLPLQWVFTCGCIEG